MYIYSSSCEPDSLKNEINNIKYDLNVYFLLNTISNRMPLIHISSPHSVFKSGSVKCSPLISFIKHFHDEHQETFPMTYVHQSTAP